MSQGTQIHGQLLSAAGLWLIVSPIVLLSQTSLSTGTSDKAILASMSMGFLALVIAGLNTRYHRWVCGALGIALGVATLGGPWVLGYADHFIVALSSSITGVAIISIAVAECFGSNQHGHS